MRFSASSLAAAAISLPLVAAQTFTTCNPLQKSCPQDTGLNKGTFASDFSSGSSANASWSAAAYSTITYGSNGAEFSIAQDKQAPTINTDFYIFFGRVDVKMRAAPGTGIISSIVFESDDLDEIDWEFLGGNTTVVETNFFGKGNTSAYDRAIYYPVSTPQTEFHTYTVDWNSERIEWIIDGTTVRTLAYDDPLTNGGQNYPQTPMKLKLGNWCGGCDGEPKGTVEWSGGQTSFDDAPYVMYVESVSIQNYNPADSYEYSDQSGSWKSIKIINNGQSSSPTGSGNPTNLQSISQTQAPTKPISVSHIMNTAAAVSTTVKGNVSTATTTHPGSNPTGGPLGASGSSGSASASATGTGGAVSLEAMSSASLIFAMLSSFLFV